MKKIILSASIVFSFLATSNAIAQQGFGTNQPDRSAAVDIVSSKRGLLIPRVGLKSTTQADPVTTPANSLLVYNTATTGDVTPGFYYWEVSKWVRFVSSTTEKTVTVTQGENVKVTPTVDAAANTTDYEVSIQGGGDGQVLVTQIIGGVTTTVWVDPADFVNDVITAENGLTYVPAGPGQADNLIKLGGALTETTTIGAENFKLAITGLEDVSATFDGNTQHIVIMGADGILKITSPKSMVEDAIANGNLDAKTLTGNGITVTAGGVVGTDLSVANSLLKDVTLGIADGAITNTKLADGAVSADKMTSYTSGDGTTNPAGAGLVPVADGNGNVTYQEISATLGKDITTDGIIVIGAGETSVLENAVLLETALKIKDGGIGTAQLADNAITSEKILDGEVKAVDLGADPVDEGKVATVNADGTVSYQEISAGTLVDAKKIATDGIIKVNGVNELLESVLIDAELSIAAGGIDTAQLADNAITSEKILDGEVKAADLGADAADEGKVATVNADGTVSYKDVSSTLGKNITTDGKIVIGANEESVLANAVLVETALKIKAGSIEASDLANAGADKVLVTNNAGDVIWVDQSTIESNDTFGGTAPITVVGVPSATTGGNDYTIGVNNADGVDAGIVKEAATNPTINFVDGVATVNVENIAATQGKALSSNSITVSTAGAKALLADTEIEITAGTAAGQVMVTKEVAGTPATFITEWVDANSLGNTVAADNGLTMDVDNNIQLGGLLIKDTEIDASDKTLAVKGLKASAVKTANIVLADEDTGVLRQVARSLEHAATASFVVTEITDYDKFVPEITILVTIGGSTIDITLPNAEVAKGQVINVKIRNTDESHTGEVNIPGVDGTTIYGSMPYQGWILKSNGTSWSVVGRN